MFLLLKNRNYQSPFTDLFFLDSKICPIFLAFWVVGGRSAVQAGLQCMAQVPSEFIFHFVGIASFIL